MSIKIENILKIKNTSNAQTSINVKKNYVIE